MAKDKPSLNPATAHLKSQKQREIKKSKAATTQQRTEKLPRRNPDRLQKQIDALQAQRDAQGGKLRPKDEQTLEQLEKDVRLVRKARDSQPGAGRDRREEKDDRRSDRRKDSAPDNNSNPNRITLGKRRWGDRENGEPQSEETETDEEVRRIPMPKDSPPPIPPRHLQRKVRKNVISADEAMAARKQLNQQRQPEKKPVGEAKKVYSSAPQVRDLHKEAAGRFVPAAVAARKRQNQEDKEAREGRGRLLEPEDVERMEREDQEKGRGEARKEGKLVDEMEDEERRLMRELGEDVMDEGQKAVDEAEKEAQYDAMAATAVTGEDASARVVDEALARAAEENGGVDRDVAGAAEEAEKEAEFHLASMDATDDPAAAEEILHQVQVEEVLDEEYGGQPNEPQKVEEEDSFW